MKHAIRRLEEERRWLADAIAEIGRGPSSAGGALGAAYDLRQELEQEMGEVDAALKVLRGDGDARAPHRAAAGRPEPVLSAANGWDHALFEPWSRCKARRTAERRAAAHV